MKKLSKLICAILAIAMIVVKSADDGSQSRNIWQETDRLDNQHEEID